MLLCLKPYSTAINSNVRYLVTGSIGMRAFRKLGGCPDLTFITIISRLRNACKDYQIYCASPQPFIVVFSSKSDSDVTD